MINLNCKLENEINKIIENCIIGNKIEIKHNKKKLFMKIKKENNFLCVNIE